MAALTTGTYSGLVSPPSGGNSPAIFFSWIDENGKTYTSLYKDNVTNTATITSMTSSSVKGNFSGKIYEALNQDSDPLTFSGEFVVKRMN